MNHFQAHLRNTFLAGIFAVVPLAATAFLIYKIDEWTRGISGYLFGREIPFVGVIIAVAAIYLVGLIATISIGKVVIHAIDALITRVPGLKQVYVAWKQIALTPDGTEGVFSRVTLVRDDSGTTQLGFTCGKGIENDPDTFCVFVPAAPNPMNGRMLFVHRSKCTLTDLSAEEAFKSLLSTGNYVPPELGSAMRKSIGVSGTV